MLVEDEFVAAGAWSAVRVKVADNHAEFKKNGGKNKLVEGAHR